MTTPSVGVVIGTFGNRVEWSKIAQRAIRSIENQTIVPEWIHTHGDTLAQARNTGAGALDVEYLIFLDADDELHDRYVEEMLDMAAYCSSKQAIFRPSTIGIYEDGTQDDAPVMIPRTDLRRRNCIVIGAMVWKRLFGQVGGFGEWPVLEDWALWRAMVARNAVVLDVPNAIYRVHVRPESRNADQELHGRVYREILKKVPL